MNSGNTDGYVARLIESSLKEELKVFGAVSIVGPKWCGKTTTAVQIAESMIFLQDPSKKEDYLKIAKLDPVILLEGKNPRLIDEWQLAPQIWDAVRFDVDMRREKGLYIMTGSSSVDDDGISHTGIGRISELRMRTMSLFESGNSSGTISLGDLFSGKAGVSGRSELSVKDLAALIVRGGWPDTIRYGEDEASRVIGRYCEKILDTEIYTVDGRKRDKRRMRAILKSVSRHVSGSAAAKTVLDDVAPNGEMHIQTLQDYLSVLERIYVTEDLPAWSPKLRSKSTIRLTDKRHLSDPALAAYFLDAGAADLMFDPNTFELLFESMVIRDLRVYAQALSGNVYHYRDSDNLEVDAVVHLRGGKWCAIEIKLGSDELDKAAKNLIRLSNKVDLSMNPPSFLAIITGTEYAYTREDGVHVIPAGCLRN